MATRASKRTGSRNSGKDKSAASAGPFDRDYVSVAIAYAEEAVADRAHTRHGRRLQQAARRFLDDIKRALALKHPPFNWSPEQANAACAFIEMLPHVEGTWETATIKLEPAQIFFLCNLFGFRNVDGSRRFTTALLAMARKGAKTTLAAAILLYVYCTEPEMGPQVLSAATTGSQARIVWSVAKRMVERTPDLAAEFSLEAFANAIARYEVGGTFKPINAKASSQDGLNPSALCFDELHAHKDSDLYNVLRSAAGSRKNPLYLYTTTEGHENPGPWAEVRKFAFHVLDGIITADHFLAVYYGLDDEDDDFDETKWVKANPLLGISPTMEKLREYATEARHQPSQLSEFRTKRLNRRASGARGWTDLLRWKKCDGPVDLERMARLPCWAAFDLASTTDLCAWRLVWADGDDWYTWGRRWVPDAQVKQRSERGTVKYEPWVLAGYITQTSGNVADYSVIERDILEDYERFKPKVIAYDPWNAQQMVNSLTDKKLPLSQFRQGPASYHPAMQTVQRAYISGHFHHGGDPVLLWEAANLVARKDVNSNEAPDRQRSADKIDDMAALFMAVGVAQIETDRREFKIFFV
jgi:phage terminase large subunit-like protein